MISAIVEEQPQVTVEGLGARMVMMDDRAPLRAVPGGGTLMKELNDEQVFYAFSGRLQPVLTVDSGEVVRIQTKDCLGNQVKRLEDGLDTIDWDVFKPATGPIFVRGAAAGGVLEVQIQSIEIDGPAASCTGCDDRAYGDLFSRARTRLCAIEEGELVWNERLRLPVHPTLGIVGVAPAHGSVHSGLAGVHGGALAIGATGAGSVIYLPVGVEGALFGCGGVRAVVGDGEIGFAGAEVAGHVVVRLVARPDLHLANPLLNTPTHCGVVASASTLDAAVSEAVHDMVTLVREATQGDGDELAMLFSLVGEVEVCQMADTPKTVRYMIPRTVLDACGFKL